MLKTMVLGYIAAAALIGAAKADPVDLSAYADKNGFIDVQELTCGQLANTYQEDANALDDVVQRLVQRPRAQAFPRLEEGQGGRTRRNRLLQRPSG